MWSAPLKRTALDGTEYHLLLLDSEGIDAYDQTVSMCPFLYNNISQLLLHFFLGEIFASEFA